MGEKFEANAFTGSASMRVPFAASEGRSGFGPALELAYDSSFGNGPFGFGWNLALPAISRKTEKGIPRYGDAAEPDTFVLSGAEDLVPALAEHDGGLHPEVELREAFGQRFEVRRYRPRIEGLFARIERWQNEADPADVFWRSISRDDLTTWYGRTQESRICDPADPRRVFSWLICEIHDDKGNVAAYGYKAEDSQGVDTGQLHERNRTAASRSANRYPKRIRYGNRSPYFPDPGAPSPAVLPEQWCFELVFDYGEHDANEPSARLEVQSWPVRGDPFSTCRAGFEVRTYRLCRRVLMFHHFADEPEVGEDCLVRSTDFTYAAEADAAGSGRPFYSFLRAVTHAGYRRQPGGGYRRSAMPPVEFGYSEPAIDERVRELDAESSRNLPYGVDEAVYRWIDLDGEGLPGILAEKAGHWYYKYNDTGMAREPDGGMRPRFGPLRVLTSSPAPASNGRSPELLDLAGDGQLDLVELAGPNPGFHERTPQRGWTERKAFTSLPVVDWSDPNLRFVDLTGDGHADLLITENDVLRWHPSLAESGFGPAQRVPRVYDEERGPRVVFGDPTQSIFVADMSGDGLADIVRVRNGEVCYWPNLGHGRFGAKVSMDRAPWFDAPDLFDPRRIRLADVDGSGTADILYLGSAGVRIYFNRSGNGWSPARTLPPFPADEHLSSAAAVDLLGNGTACLVWSSPLAAHARRPLRYIDLMGGRKPHLLVFSRNNVGAETHIHYTASTHFYVDDRAAGTPWITRLPFPVQVVDRVETLDRISRNRFVKRYAYHHGYFDGREREFRGFGRIDQWDTEEIGVLRPDGAPVTNLDEASYVPPVHTRTWFHTGAFVEDTTISRQFEAEYFRPPALGAGEPDRDLLPDTIVPPGLDLHELHEACRALKGVLLRQEVYAEDGSAAASIPYRVTEQDYAVRRVQARGANRHAVFFTHARESVELNYERDASDPRVVHQVTLAVDDFGNVLRSASVAYGRRQPDPGLAEPDRQRQARTLATCAESAFTNAVSEADAYRAPLPSERRVFELTGLALPGNQGRLSFAELDQATQEAQAIAYESAPDGTLQRRLIAHERIFYRPDDLGAAAGDASALLPLGALEPLGLPGVEQKLALTAGLLSEVHGTRVDEAMLLEGGYGHSEGDAHWWVSAGRVFHSPGAADTPAQELTAARAHFFLPQRFVDAFGNATVVSYDAYDLLPIATRDALDNVVAAGNDYRVLQPRLVTDANGNRSEVAFDALGLVAGTAVMGKASETLGDSLAGFVADLDAEVIAQHLAAPLADPHGLLGAATTRVVYDLFAFERTRDDAHPQPPVACVLARETHESDLLPDQSTRVQQSFSYADGFGRTIQRKARAEPGPVPRRDADGRIVLGSDGQPVTTADDAAMRWIGSGWTVFDNKGRPVRSYEPFFTDTQRFESDARVGVSDVVFYDPLGRAAATLHPDHSWDKVAFRPWQQIRWDANDLVLVEDPAADPDTGAYFRRLPADDYLPSWHARRVAGAMGARQQAAAQKAAVHADTPAIAYFDALGRPFASEVHNRFQREEATIVERLVSRVELDIQGRQLAVRDAVVQTGDVRRRLVMRFDHDLLGRVIHTASMDAGERWLLDDASGQPLRTWDSRGHAFRVEYDVLRRPVRRHVRGHDPENPSAELIYGRVEYGEAEPDAVARNLRTRPVRVFDGAGVISNAAYDFKGNPLLVGRRLAVEYRAHPDWSGSPELEPDRYETRTSYDALDRPVAITTPDASIAQPEYNEAGLLERLSIRLRGAAEASVFVAGVRRDAKGQRTRIDYGNGASTRFEYDPLTFRLARLVTRRGNEILQDLSYTYDPAGNVVDLRDDAQQSIYFANAVVDPHADYTYDALYRLIEASGREHIGQAATPHTSWDDAGRVGLAHPHDGQAMRRYAERYEYDAAGNLLRLIHTAANGSWTRDFFYDEASALEPLERGNRLSRTQVGATVEPIAHDAHGNMTAMAHLPLMQWDFLDRLHASARQVVAAGSPETIWYAYDAAGQRVRKVTERAAADGATPARLHERIYVGGFEVYREYGADGSDVALERESLHVMEGEQRIALVETRTRGDDGSPSRLQRYQLGNHLGSVCLELDADAAIIGYEEYHPYGSTAYQAGRTLAEASLKRYRFTGKERDEETGFSYHEARYYASWLGRWIAADPAGHETPEYSSYMFAAGNPVKYVDPDGNRVRVRVDHQARTVTFEAKVYTIDQTSFKQASEVAATFNRTTKTVDQGGRAYKIGFDVEVVAPPTAEFLEAELQTSLHWKHGRQRLRPMKYRRAVQKWLASVLPAEAHSAVYLGENTPSPELKREILRYGKSTLGMSSKQLQPIRDRLNGVTKVHAPGASFGAAPQPTTQKVSRGTTYLDLVVQMREFMGGTSDATKHNVRVHEFLHLLGLSDIQTGKRMMNYDFIDAEDSRDPPRKLGPRNQDVEDLVNLAIQRADPTHSQPIEVIEPARIEEWNHKFDRFRDWIWVKIP